MVLSGFSAPSVGYQQAWGSLTADASIVDGNSATGKDQPSGSPPVETTAGAYLGGIFLISAVGYVLGYQDVGDYILEYSLNSTTWFPITTPSAPAHGGTFSLITNTISGLSIAAAYIRLSVKDTFGFGGHSAVREISVTLAPIPRRRVSSSWIL